ncbi:hypothetical protein [Gimesia maris]|uniref:hypothetical protein n=1 Tax=Gimesia maris TaxID=122 RepID=UPI0032EAE29D
MMRKLPDTREEFENEISSDWRGELFELSLELYDRVKELEGIAESSIRLKDYHSNLVYKCCEFLDKVDTSEEASGCITIGNVKNPTTEMQDAIKRVDARIKSLETELSEYKRCCVMGGDGKPIGIGDRRYFRDGHGKIEPLDVLTIDVQEYNELMVNDGKFECEPQWLYSSPEDVPGGAE